MRWHDTAALVFGLLSLTSLACNSQALPSAEDVSSTPTSAGEDIGPPLYATPVRTPPIPPIREARSGVAVDPIVVADCRLAVIEKQDVPSQREGVLLFLGREVQGGNGCLPTGSSPLKSAGSVNESGA